jgi:hypothetical protein
MFGVRRGLRYVAPVGIGAWLLVACAHPVARQLDGRWFGETVENFSEDEIAVATGWARGTSFEFSGTTLTVTVPAEEPRTGRFEIASANDQDVVLDVSTAPEGPKKKMELTLVEGGLLRWHLDEMRSIVFRHE